MKRHFLAFIFTFVLAGQSFASSSSEGLLDSLDNHLQHADEFQFVNKQRIGKLRDCLHKTSRFKKMNGYEDLGNRFSLINVDSATYYYDLGRQIAQEQGDNDAVVKFDLLKLRQLPQRGLIDRACMLYENIDPKTISHKNKALFFETGHQIYWCATEYYEVDSLRTKGREQGNRMLDSLLMYLPANTPKQLFFQATGNYNRGSYKRAAAELQEVMEQVPFSDNLYAKAAAIMALCYAQMPGHRVEEERYLALSAMSDLEAGTTETTSLHRLGKLLYERGDIDRAYEYLCFSLTKAIETGSRLRELEIAEGMPLVLETARDNQHQNTRSLTIGLLILAVVTLALVTQMYLAFRERRHLAVMRERLAQSNSIKDGLIRQIFTLCGTYLNALENFNKLAGRKIKASQVSDLLTMIESGKIVRDQLQHFYEVFDPAFLMMYPDFVDEVNKLLMPDRRIAPAEGNRLTPELRILAFMRLGLDDSTQISKFLGLSLNTVYTYRNKLKARAQNRETFENDVRNIGNLA